jgi:hypothetical protein
MAVDDDYDEEEDMQTRLAALDRSESAGASGSDDDDDSDDAPEEKASEFLKKSRAVSFDLLVSLQQFDGHWAKTSQLQNAVGDLFDRISGLESFKKLSSEVVATL